LTHRWDAFLLKLGNRWHERCSPSLTPATVEHIGSCQLEQFETRTLVDSYGAN
jgi:hypothetical protein